MELFKKRKKLYGTILLIIAFVILSIIMPFLQSKLKEFDYKNEHSALLLIQAEIVSTNVKMETNFGNLLSIVTDPRDTLANKTIEYYRKSAKEQIVGRLILLFTALYDEVPSKQQLDKWNSMNFDELQKEVGSFWQYRETWNIAAKERTEILGLLIYLLYGFSLICYSVGLYWVNIGFDR
ncbi:MAG: hypothetical protein A2145_03485 [candidate division Zixibacteria bacterium RBG_16_40_9]|nr:MAG: hypothetical protein A2145_03485 [candidate division Zixibacteria bacterium RBG_16_40_9]